MYIYLSLFVALVGAVGYLTTTRPDNKELYRMAFFAGLLAFLIAAGTGHLTLFGYRG